MKLADLTKPQWDAALEAARVLMSSNPAIAEDRAGYRAAKARLSALLPEGADAPDLIKQAVRWDGLNSLAAAFVGMPDRAIEAVR